MSDDVIRQCPDGGQCDHECMVECWRVVHAAPLSGVYHHDRWPDSVVEPQRELDARRRQVELLIGAVLDGQIIQAEMEKRLTEQPIDGGKR